MSGEPSSRSVGLPGLRRSGAVTELLFLYECLTTEPTQLRPIADALGLTVQAVSHSYRQLARRGLAEVREGRYCPTVAGVAWLHGALGHVGEDVRRRLDQLYVVRSCRAIALDDLTEGDAVSLELEDGLLSARKGGRGPSRGRVITDARRGTLVDVGALEGIVPLTRATVSARTLSLHDLRDPDLVGRVRRAIMMGSAAGLLAAVGLEAYLALRAATDRPVVRFAVAAAVGEASKLGVPSTVWLMDTDLPRFLAGFAGPDPPPLEVRPLRGAGSRVRPGR